MGRDIELPVTASELASNEKSAFDLHGGQGRGKLVKGSWHQLVMLAARSLSARNAEEDAQISVRHTGLEHPADARRTRTSSNLASARYSRLMRQWPEKTKRIVMRAAFLPRITGWTAAELTGEPDAAAVFGGLAREHGFVVREADAQGAYRYCAEFRSYIRDWARRTLSPQELAELLWRATELMAHEQDEAGNEIQNYVRSQPVHALGVRLCALGGFAILRGGMPVPKQRKAAAKPLALLRALVALGGQSVPAYKLADMLWPDAEGDSALARFNATLHRARRLIGLPNAIVMREGLVSVNRAVVACDVFEFEQAVDELTQNGSPALHDLSQKLLRSYPGTLLPEHSSDAWLEPYRTRLASKFASAVLRLGRRLETEGDARSAQALYLEAAAREPLCSTLRSLLPPDNGHHV